MVDVAVNVNDWPPQAGFVPEVKAVAMVGEMVPLVVTVIGVDVAVVGLAQLKLEVISHVTTCPFVNEEEVYVTPFATFTPSNFHWYTGVVPPLVGVAVNVIAAPAQVGFEPEVTAVDTAGTIPVVNDITMAFEVNAPPEVMIQVTDSLVNVVVV